LGCFKAHAAPVVGPFEILRTEGLAAYQGKLDILPLL
jgi:hypothetical protein